MTTHNELLAEATQNYALAHHYLGKLKVVLDQLSAVQSGIARASRPPVRCVREWQDWLAVNGPTVKGDIQEATGIKFTERGTPYTVEWTSSLAHEPEDRFAPNTLMKINTKAEGRGAPPKIFFLWSQRWDVYPLFGVGPIRPTEEELHEAADLAASKSRLGAGLIMIPEWTDQNPQAVDNFNEEVERLMTAPTRFATVEEWNEANAAWFDAQVASESKPTAEQKQALLDTLPDGTVDGNTLIAVAYSEAVKRARQPQTLLGVVYPPTSEG